MKKIIACILTGLLLFSLSGPPVLAKPGGGKNSSAPGIARASSNNNQAAKNASFKVIKNRTKQTTQLEQKLQNRALTEAVKSKNQARIRQELKEKLAAQNKEQTDNTLPSFSDINNHWGAKSIKKLAALGIINGYPDGSFKPEGQITQAEALSLIMRVADVEADETEIDETNAANTENEGTTENVESGETEADENNSVNTENENATETDELEAVPDWAKNAARIAARQRIINLNRFHSHIQATRLQTAVWIAKALGIEPADTSNIPFKDGILISKEDLGYIIALYNMGIIKGTPDGKFNPNSHITRAEIAAIIERILEKSTDEEGTENTEITEENNSFSADQTEEITGTENTSESTPESETSIPESETQEETANPETTVPAA